MQDPLKKRLLNKLENLEKKELAQYNVVMLPDFFIDHLVYFNTVEKACNAIKNIAAQGGGNLPGIIQQIHQGGNAANTALGLARLGIKSYLICQTDSFGLYSLKYFLEKYGVDISGVKTEGKLAITTALEFQNNCANIMIGDPGSVAAFTFEMLNDHDYELIASADLVGVTNWNLNRYGTNLAYKVFEIAKKHNVKTFFDSGDPSPRMNDIPELIQNVLMNPQLDIFGLNENELRYYSKSVFKTQKEIIIAIKLLKKKVPARIDFHTALFSSTIQSATTVVPTISLPRVYRSTGAGDAWNAANIFADLLGFADDERLLFANIFAGQFISSPDIIHPTMDMVINFIKKII